MDSEDIEQLTHFSVHLCRQNLVDILNFYAEINEVRGQERIYLYFYSSIRLKIEIEE